MVTGFLGSVTAMEFKHGLIYLSIKGNGKII